MRRARTLLVPVLVLAVGTLIGACSSSASPPALANATGVMVTLPDAANAAGTVHFVQVTRLGKSVSTLTGDLNSATSGDQSENLESETGGKHATGLTVERVNDVVYIRAPAVVLASTLQLSGKQTAPYAGKWVSVSPGDFVYSSIESTLSLTDQIKAFVPTGFALHVGAETPLHGTSVVPVTGPPPSLAKGARGSLTVFVKPQAPHLPVAATEVLQKGSEHESVFVTYTKWGKPVKLTAPTGAVSYRSIATSP